MKIKLHFNRINMQRKLSSVWTAHTSKACNQAEEILIEYNGKPIGRTVFNPEGNQPRAYVQFYGSVKNIKGQTVIDVGN